MKKSFFISFVVLMSMAVMPISIKAQDFEKYSSYIDANGYAEREVAPDVFYLKVNIDESLSKGKNSLEAQQKEMLSALKKIGINIEEQITRLSLTSQYHNRKSNYAFASYQIKCNSSEQLSEAWQRLDDLGISDVSFIKAEYSKIEDLKDEVRKDAIKNARDIAASMAEAIGQSIGECFYISSGYSGNNAVYAMPRLTKSMAMYDTITVEEAAVENIEFDNIKVTINVSAKFVLLN